MMATALGGLPLPGRGSGDELVSKVVTGAIAALFKRTGKLRANVRAEPLTKLLQGSVDGFDLIGQGMLMYNGLRIEAMEFYLHSVAIDFGAIFSGQVKLRQPTQATMRVVLTQEDLTTSFNTPFVVDKLQQLQYQGQNLHFRNTRVTLSGDKSLGLRSQVRLGDTVTPLDIDLTAFLQVEERRKIQFVDVTYRGSEAAIALSKAIIGHVNALLDLNKFTLDGTQLRVDQVRLRENKITFYGTAQIDQFPRRRSSGA